MTADLTKKISGEDRLTGSHFRGVLVLGLFHLRKVFVMHLRSAFLLAIALLLYPATTFSRQTSALPSGADGVAASSVLLSELPLALREAGAVVLDETDEGDRAKLAGELAEEWPADSMDFLIALLDRESSAAVRAEIVNRLGAYRHPKVQEALHKRLDASVEESDEVAGSAFVRLVRGQRYSLPGPLSLGRLKAVEEPLRVLAFGDFGSGSRAQRQVAAGMLAFHREHPFDLGITVGDNFYPSGLSSPVHRRWRSQWESLYTPLGIEFYATLGNHDTRDPVSPYAQVLRTKRSASWRMPAPSYTFTAGHAQFFAIDTNKGRLTEGQLDWLATELKKSTARWKIVYGHHPIKSDGEHGDDAYTARMRRVLLPRLKEGGAHVYWSGHDHDMQALKPEGGLRLFISGGGGTGSRALGPANHRLWGRSSLGFTVIEADAERLDVIFVGPGGERLHTTRLTKDDW